MVRLRPARNWRAASLRTKPSSSIARSTLSLVSWPTRSGRLSTLETVPRETPARWATSFTLADPATRTPPPR